MINFEVILIFIIINFKTIILLNKKYCNMVFKKKKGRKKREKGLHHPYRCQQVRFGRRFARAQLVLLSVGLESATELRRKCKKRSRALHRRTWQKSNRALKHPVSECSSTGDMPTMRVKRILALLDGSCIYAIFFVSFFDVSLLWFIFAQGGGFQSGKRRFFSWLKERRSFIVKCNL